MSKGKYSHMYELAESINLNGNVYMEALELLDKRESPGIIVVAPPMRLLHINKRAQTLTNTIHAGHNGHNPSVSARGLVPTPVSEVCSDIFNLMQSRCERKDWEQFEVRRLIGLDDQPVIVRGFGLPDSNNPKQSRVVILVEAISRRNARQATLHQAQMRFRLTERECTVVQCLAKGWTNKEIALALKISLPTVKEHIRHIMEKTQSTTRTGIFAKIFNVDLGGPLSLHK